MEIYFCLSLIASILVVFVSMILICFLSKTKPETESHNIYGVEKKSGYDPVFTMYSKIMTTLGIIALVVDIICATIISNEEVYDALFLMPYCFAYVLIYGVFFFVLMLPTSIARKKEHKQIKYITFLNLFLAPTIIVWIATIIWVNSSNGSYQQQSSVENLSDKLTELHNLKVQGILTEEEFNEKKKEFIRKF